MIKKPARWMVYTKKADFNKMAGELGISPVTARLLRNRGVQTAQEGRDYLFGGLSLLHAPDCLPDMEKACGIIKKAISDGKKIRVVGDYDIDGVCSSCILLKAFWRLGACADCRIPERVRDGYGINENIIRQAAEDGIALIVTCDNGIAAAKELSLAKALGLEVVVTDHHEVPTDASGRERLPEAAAIINPKRAFCRYPYKNICGGMVAFKLVQQLFGAEDAADPALTEYMQLAAIATVGDVMPLEDENRALVKAALPALAETENTGLSALIRACGLDGKKITAGQIGFVLGPCMNAGGRLRTANMVLELFLCEDMAKALARAEELKALNDERKLLTKEAVDAACLQAEEECAGDDILVIFLPSCHESIAGIVAGRVREKYDRPAMVITRSGGLLKGSGRSIPAYNMFEGINAVSDIFEKYGGHPMAAGFSLKEERLTELRKRLNADSGLSEEDMTACIWADMQLYPEYITEKLVEEMELLAPFGQGNEKPKFAERNLRVTDVRLLGKNRNVIRLSLQTERGGTARGVLFGDCEDAYRELCGMEKIDVIFTPQMNEYNGEKTLQLEIKDFRKSRS